MKNQDLKLKFIENGRMSDSSMQLIFGGVGGSCAWVYCDILTICSGINKNHCVNYETCVDASDKNNCSDYYYVYATTPITKNTISSVVSSNILK